MINFVSNIIHLDTIRNRYEKKYSTQKLSILIQLQSAEFRDFFVGKKGAEAIRSLNGTLLFLLAYPDNRKVYNSASGVLEKLEDFITGNAQMQDRLYNSGITRSQLCASFGFEIVKWMRQTHREDIRLNDIEADDSQVQSILSAVLPKVESEIMQDGNASWKPWLKQFINKEEDMLDKLIAVFDQSDIRPEVKDELWSALGINVEISFPCHTCLPETLFTPFYHRSLIKKAEGKFQSRGKALKIQLTEKQEAQIISCARIALMRQLREIDPISYTDIGLLDYYQLPRGLSVVLMEMLPDRRHPIDSYLGYMAFKNGIPMAYAGSWILFDSARIGTNVFSDYRGGESRYIFKQVMDLHQQVYKLKRFTVDPYQIGKDNKDGIHSGAFWLYYKAGFRPIKEEQKDLAEKEALLILADRDYRSSYKTLKKLADSRMELIHDKKAVNFDATDLSRRYADIIRKQFNNNRKQAEAYCLKRLMARLGLKGIRDKNLSFIHRNFCVLLFNKAEQVKENRLVKTRLKLLFELKANGREKDYIRALQQSKDLFKKFIDSFN